MRGDDIGDPVEGTSERTEDDSGPLHIATPEGMRLGRGRLLLEEDNVMPDVHVVHQHDDPSSPEDPEDGDHDEDAGQEDVQERSSKEVSAA